MKYTPEHVAEAEARIGEARARLIGTLGEIQQRLRPSTLAQDAVESAAAGVARVARNSADAVRKRPLAIAAVVGAVGLFMARSTIGAIISGSDATPPPSDSLKSKTVTKKRVVKGQSK